MSYLSFVVANARLLGFGLALAAFSSFGQTFYIALFGTEIRDAFALSHGGFGAAYSVATLASAACLVWLGRWFDEVDLRAWTALLCTGLALACLLMAWSPAVPFLVAAIFGLRLFGQGLLSHASSAGMARYFMAGRGRALGIAGLGHPLGEAVLPLPAVALTALIGWRVTWAVVAALVLFAALPFALWLLRGHADRQRGWLERRAHGAQGAASVEVKWTRAEVVRDPVFYLLLPASLASSYVMTGFFFHQAHLAQSKGWPLSLIAGSFTAWALASVAAALFAGDFVDRRGATRAMPFALVPMCAGLVALSATDSALVAPVYLGLAGASQGMHMTVQGALWAEIYGVRHIGAIRALTTGLAVLATALAPVTMGWLIDAGVSMEAVALGSVAATAGCIALALRGLARHAQRG